MFSVVVGLVLSMKSVKVGPWCFVDVRSCFRSL